MYRSFLQKRLQAPQPLFSVEFFPPKSENAALELLQTAAQLKAYAPDFASITYGAGGSTRSRTLNYARRLHDELGYAMMPHLTCVGHSKDELRAIIHEFKAAGLEQIMALRGDPPKGERDFTSHPQGLSYANELVQLIREEYPSCAIGVAGYPEKHPEAPSMGVDLVNLKRKVDAGATFITTQLFFDNTTYFRFRDECADYGIEVPILPGLLSVSSFDQAQRFCAMCGSHLPAELEAQLRTVAGDKVASEAAGAEWLYQQAKELLNQGAPGLHLYILNRAEPAIQLMERLQADGFYQ
ncbi:MAG: methylenetetrahydrofolate reductase [NAD(P)H] [Opitutales bacterium]